MRKRLPRWIYWIGLGIGVLVLTAVLPTVPVLLQGLYSALGATWRATVDLLTITLITVLFASLLAPLEALGWWAGWYGDQIQTDISPGTLAEPLIAGQAVRRYVVYLDGISQAQHLYIPEVERFLQELVTALPDDIVLIKGIIPYSVLNRPLTEDRLLSFFWRMADRLQMNPTGGILGLLLATTINIRNVLTVSVVADQRYGPIYNQGTAQIIHNSLLTHGYQPGGGVPLTLLGYSGGGQVAMGAAAYLKRSLNAPIDVISLAGVLSGNHNALALEHVYHIRGDRDWVEKEGSILFPRRWKIFFLSDWNRAKHRGKITLVSLGPVGHNAGTGPYSTTAHLPDGRTHLQQTVELIASIVQGSSPLVRRTQVSRLGNYDLYHQAAFNRPEHYPLQQSLDPDLYRAIAPWMGRLILPHGDQRRQVKGALFEVYHTEPGYEHLVGQQVPLRWGKSVLMPSYLRSVTKDLYFSEEAEYSMSQGLVHPYRLDRWQQVNPLESLAGARPYDDVVVRLNAVTVAAAEEDQDGTLALYITAEPVQITGRYYALVKILGRVPAVDESAPRSIAARMASSGYSTAPDLMADLALVPDSGSDSGSDSDLESDWFRVVHFNPATRAFDQIPEIVQIPQVVAGRDGVSPSTNRQLERSPLNETGWYIYGEQDCTGKFVVRAIAPRALLRLQPDRVIFGKDAAWEYIKHDAWANVVAQKGRVSSVLLCPTEPGSSAARQEAGRDQASDQSSDQASDQSSDQTKDGRSVPMQSVVSQWREGDRALLLHVYGGIGGKQREAAANTPIFFGHFAYGVATVVHEPLAQELSFDICYYQVYTHNQDGIIAGALAWHRYLGDRQFGWLGVRPVCDMLIKLDAFTQAYDFVGINASALDSLIHQLEMMTARYRIGDGTGGTYVGPAHNCAQDSNQALYAAVKHLGDIVKRSPAIHQWLDQNPAQARRFQHLVNLGRAIKRKLLPFGTARADWQDSENTLGISPEEDVFEGLLMGLVSWRTLLPRLASETVTRQFLNQGAQVWVLRTTQVGGYDPDIEPIAPTPLG